ncbi:MarR family winged helix-turn-helix transcriptional regulator [Micropruina sonneratiae]|uniref:MarR family winged helix-turn-helix transcriptional regulator n=1 Tax=Micropruina sonneratiae TaxID=2986940 RepID=UPI0022261011|nr:MarR family transcriptional regulator [Micropruina sp. KQZ13P-5]MCW3158893.1 MarR family transcriptional regulator [Micropruina sp. KQZ13P-5]
MHTPSASESLVRAAAGLSRWASAQADLGAPAATLRLLVMVEEQGPIRIGDLAEADHTSQPAVTRQVGRLETLGWAARTPDPDDARACLVTITEPGRRALVRARRARGDALDRVLAEAGIAEDRVQDAADLLEHLLTAARAVAEKV